MSKYGAVANEDENDSLIGVKVHQRNSRDEYDEAPSVINQSINASTALYRRDSRYLYGLVIAVIMIVVLPVAFTTNSSGGILALFSKPTNTGSTTSSIPSVPAILPTPSSIIPATPSSIVPAILTFPPSPSTNDVQPPVAILPDEDKDAEKSSGTKSPTVAPTDSPTYGPTYVDIDMDYYLDYYESDSIRFTTYRDGYDILSLFDKNASDIYKYKFLYPYTGVIEPYADMYIKIIDDGAENSGKYYHKFTICADYDATISVNSDSVITESQCVEGYDSDTIINFACTPLYSNYTVTIEQYDAETDEPNGETVDGGFMCMYVRREFRSLTADDLEKTMDAMYAMWDISEEEGQELYGDSYHNYAYLLEFHYFNAAWIDSDHIHEGNGFAPQHFKMSNIFEKSMQAVEPSISLPYWDFTIEASQNISVWDSPLFTPDTFGTLGYPNNDTWGWLFESNDIDDGKIFDGRWAYLEAEENSNFPELDYAYGYVRAPWNMNPSKYITRYTSVDKDLPSCSSHYTLLEYSSITDFLHQIPYAAHASTHGVIGGVFGCDVMNDLREAGYINGVDGQLNLCKNWIFYLKEFYRSDVLLPASDCIAQDEDGNYSTSKDSLDCDYVCDNSRMNILFLMLQHSVLNSDYDCVPEYGVMPDEGWTAWKEFICGGEGSLSFGGDHLESASPADPSFWPIHPTLERLLQVKYMSGGFDTDEWPTDPVNDYVCNKGTCYDPDEGDFGTWDSCCYGHYIDDKMYDAPNNDKTTVVGPTNRQVMMWNDPTKSYYGNTYIYDNFKWDHCSDYNNLDFDALVTSLHSNATFNVSTSSSEKGW